MAPHVVPNSRVWTSYCACAILGDPQHNRPAALQGSCVVEGSSRMAHALEPSFTSHMLIMHDLATGVGRVQVSSVHSHPAMLGMVRSHPRVCDFACLGCGGVCRAMYPCCEQQQQQNNNLPPGLPFVADLPVHQQRCSGPRSPVGVIQGDGLLHKAVHVARVPGHTDGHLWRQEGVWHVPDGT